MVRSASRNFSADEVERLVPGDPRELPRALRARPPAGDGAGGRDGGCARRSAPPSRRSPLPCSGCPRPRARGRWRARRSPRRRARRSRGSRAGRPRGGGRCGARFMAVAVISRARDAGAELKATSAATACRGGPPSRSRRAGAHPTISLPEKNCRISISAFSALSEPWTEFSPIELRELLADGALGGVGRVGGAHDLAVLQRRRSRPRAPARRPGRRS